MSSLGEQAQPSRCPRIAAAASHIAARNDSEAKPVSGRTPDGPQGFFTNGRAVVKQGLPILSQ